MSDHAEEQLRQSSADFAKSSNPQEKCKVTHDCNKTREHFHHAEDLHSHLIRSWNELPPKARSNDLSLYTSDEHEAARTLIVLILLDSLSHLLASDIAKAQSLIFPMLYYFSLGGIMPDLIAQVLKAKLDEIVEILEGKSGDLPQWLVLEDSVKEEVLHVIRGWTVWMSRPEEASCVSKLREVVVRSMQQVENESHQSFSTLPLGCEKEVEFHRRFGILTMNWASHELFYEEELQRAYMDFDVENPALADDDFLTVVDAEWRRNPSFRDAIPSDASSRPSSTMTEQSLPSRKPRHSPSSFTKEIVQRGAKAPEDQGLMEYVSYWFNGVSHAIAGRRDTVKVEILLHD